MASAEYEVVELPTDSPVAPAVVETEAGPQTEDELLHQRCFLACFGLVTTAYKREYDNKRAVRKTRSTVKSPCVLSNWQSPTEMKTILKDVNAKPEVKLQMPPKRPRDNKVRKVRAQPKRQAKKKAKVTKKALHEGLENCGVRRK